MHRLTFRERRVAAVLAVALVLAGLAAANVAILLSPEQLRRRLVAYTAQFVHGDVELEGVRFGLTGRGQVARAVLRPSPIEGAEAGGELRIEGLRLDDAPLELWLHRRYHVLRIAIDSMEARVTDPARFLETFQRLVEVDPEGHAPPAPVEIGRLTIDLTGGGDAGLPLFTAAGKASQPIVLGRVRVVPEGGGRRFFRISATYKGGPLEACAIAGRVDMQAATLALDLRASNLDLRGRSLAGLSPGVQAFLAALGPAGPFDLTLEASVSWQRPRETAVQGQVDCYGLTLAPPAFPRPFTDVAGRIRFDGNRVEVEDLAGLYGSASVHLHGAIADVERGSGVDLGAWARGLDLVELGRVPLPEPFAGAVRALGLGGRGDLRIAVATEEGQGIEAARVEAALAAREPTLECAALAGVAGEVTLAGRLGPAEALAGDLRIVRGELKIGGARGGDEDAPKPPALRAVAGRIAIARGEVSIDRLEGRLADGAFHAMVRAGLGGAGGLLRVDVAARDVDLAPLAAAFFERPLDFAGRASGTLSISRAAAARFALIRADLELGPVDPRTIPAVSSLCETLLVPDASPRAELPIPFERGRFTLAREADGTGRAKLALGGPVGTIAADAAVRADGTLAGTAQTKRAGARGAASYTIGGSFLAPEIRPVPGSASKPAD